MDRSSVRTQKSGNITGADSAAAIRPKKGSSHAAHRLSQGDFQKKLRIKGRHSDGRGLWLQVYKPAERGRDAVGSYLFQFTAVVPETGKTKKWQMGLGSFYDVTLEEAREKARQAYLIVRSGQNPILLKNAQAATPAVPSATFAHCAEMFIEQAAKGWDNPKHIAQWKSTLKTYAYPVIGDMSVANVETRHILTILKGTEGDRWTEKNETMERVLNRIKRVLDWAKVAEFRQGENPARWDGHLEHMLPPPSKVKKVRRQPALKYADIPVFMAELRAKNTIAARALEFTILTATRTGAVIGAPWSEFSLGQREWAVSAFRAGTKAQDHETEPRLVPLVDRAIEILKGLPREDGNEFVFIGGGKNAHLSDMAMNKCLKGMREGVVPHGFRSTFKDWCTECTNHPNELSELALFHSIPNSTEAAYRRGPNLKKRALMMGDWEHFCYTGQSRTTLLKDDEGGA